VSNSLSPPQTLVHTGSGSRQRAAMVPVKLHWAPPAQHKAFRTSPQKTGRRRQGSRGFAASFGWVALFQLSFALRLGGLVTRLVRQGVSGLSGAATAHSARGQCGVSGALAFPLIPAGTAPARRGLTSRLHFPFYLKLQISSHVNILVSAAGSPQFHSEVQEKTEKQRKTLEKNPAKQSIM